MHRLKIPDHLMMVQQSPIIGRNRDRTLRVIVIAMIAYFIISIATLPFLNAFWLGELPVLAIIQAPKISLANWLRVDVVMEFIRTMGWSQGSFSPDYSMARPYGLILAYLIPAIPFLALVWFCTGFRPPFSRLIFILISLATIDFFCTLYFGTQRYITIY